MISLLVSMIMFKITEWNYLTKLFNVIELIGSFRTKSEWYKSICFSGSFRFSESLYFFYSKNTHTNFKRCWSTIFKSQWFGLIFYFWSKIFKEEKKFPHFLSKKTQLWTIVIFRHCWGWKILRLLNVLLELLQLVTLLLLIHEKETSSSQNDC